MSKINRIRFVNLNYNNNTMKADDVDFTLQGDNSLLSLRNGGGKTVLVQMITAPFVKGRFRNTKERSFTSYFTSSTPTYILVEWKLDDNAGFVLTGMMVRMKTDTNQGNGQNKLDITNFIYEYSEANEYDISSIPFVEEKNGRKIIKSYSNSKKFLENLKKDRGFKFNYYDMNNSVTSRQYFSKLEEYRIYYKEWQSIIREVNKKESGLSELFTNAKDSNGLVKKWFLPTVEDKLKIDEDRIENYRLLVDSYIKQYKRNKSNIDKKIKMELFISLSYDISVGANKLKNSIENCDGIKNNIANTLGYLKDSVENRLDEENKLDEEIESTDNSIKELQYEEESIKIHRINDEIDVKEKELLVQNENIELCNQSIDDLIKKSKVLECAKIHRNYQELSKKIQQYETEIAILNKKNEDNVPRINDLGYTLKNIYSIEINDIVNCINDKEEEKEVLIEEKDSIREFMRDCQKQIHNLGGTKASLVTLIDAYSKVENKFNNNYKCKLQRNIEGYYDRDGLEDVKTDINENLGKYEGSIYTNSKKHVMYSEELKVKESDGKRIQEDITKEKFKLEASKNKLKEADNELENRIGILKYIGFNKDKILANKEIVEAFNSKIDLLNKNKKSLEMNHDKVMLELNKLRQGKVVELPKELEEKLRNREIKFIYGMQWLKKNDFSYKENMEIIRKNPFIPYSLIMSDRDIEILEQQPLDAYTSSLISIVNRKDLEENIGDVNKDIVGIDKVKFLVSFNNKLLNEKELKKIIVEKEEVLTNLQNDITSKEEEIEFFDKKKNNIKFSALTEESYVALKKDIEDLAKELDRLKELESLSIKKINKLDADIKELETSINEDKESLNTHKRKKIDFDELKSEYELYEKNMKELNYVLSTLEVVREELIANESRLDKVGELIESCNDMLVSYSKKEEESSKRLDRFISYNEGRLIEKDMEDVLAEYDALTKNISDSEETLRQKLYDCNGRFKRTQNELIKKTDAYKLQEQDYISELYDFNRELEVNAHLEDARLKLEQLKQIHVELAKEIAVDNERVKSLCDKLMDKYGSDKPKVKELLFDKNFREEISELRGHIKALEKNKKVITKYRERLEQNLTNLNEYKEFEITNKLDIVIESDELDDVIGRLKRDYRISKETIANDKMSLTKLVMDIKFKEEFIDDSLFNTAIATLGTLIGKPETFINQLDTYNDVYQKTITKFMVDIELIEKEEEKILSSILEYLKEVHHNIEMIDDNSTIKIDGRRLKMLNIVVDLWDDKKELYKIRLKDYIVSIRDLCLSALDNNEGIEDIISNNINVIKLYDGIVGIDTVSIKLYKIEENKQKSITWNEVSKNSGGEGFLSAFVILSSLLSYMRKDQNEIFNRRESGKVLIMDNPFAQTNASHLLKPLIEIADKCNTQLICLTGLGGDSIYNRFDNIYVLNLIPSRLKQGVNYLRGEHIKGNDEYEVVASRFKIEDQMKLF